MIQDNGTFIEKKIIPIYEQYIEILCVTLKIYSFGVIANLGSIWYDKLNLQKKNKNKTIASLCSSMN